jgi:hypothetical protein
MPKHLFPGYRQNRAASATNENTGDDNENEEDDEGNSFHLFRYSIVK